MPGKWLECCAETSDTTTVDVCATLGAVSAVAACPAVLCGAVFTGSNSSAAFGCAVPAGGGWDGDTVCGVVSAVCGVVSAVAVSGAAIGAIVCQFVAASPLKKIFRIK